MTIAKPVPVTTDMSGDDLSAEDAWHTIRRHGLLRLTVDAFARFRFGDGFANSRALALQLALSLLPFLIGLMGLAADLDVDRPARVLARTVTELIPGGRQNDVLSSALSPGSAAERAGQLALALGLLLGMVAAVLSMGQVERGANRIYGIDGDRDALEKHVRATLLTAVVAVPVGLGFALLVAGGSVGDAMQDVYGWSSRADTVWDVVRWPVGLLLTTVAVAVIFRHAPRRRQPALSWLALGAAVAVALTMLASGLLAVYLSISSSFGNVYGPLAGIIALLVWCNLISFALFFGTAIAAQLEGLRAGITDPKGEEKEPAAARGRS